MNYRNWEYITADHKVVAVTGSIENPVEEIEASEIPESDFAQYLNHLIDQIQMCWEIIRNREAKPK